MTSKLRVAGRAVSAALATLPLFMTATAAAARDPAYEVWIIDQSDTRGLDHGGTLHIFPGQLFRGGRVPAAGAAERVDLGGEASLLCREKTGASPVRPHMVVFDQRQRHALVAFVASGHVLVLDAASRKPVDCLRTSKAPTGQQAHAAFPSPDGAYVLVANQNGKRLERIDSDFAAGRFSLNPQATLDFASCSTPSGAPCQDPSLRPDNAPICPVLGAGGDLAFVTLRGGGMFVVDPRATPMRIIAEYDRDAVHGNGCGGLQIGDRLYVNSGGRPGAMEHLHVYGFDVYRFDLPAFESKAPMAPNSPAAAVVFHADGQHDSHGMVLAGRRGLHLWVMDRHADTVEVFAAATEAHVGTIALNGAQTDNAAPDLTDASPRGDLVFVALRGPTPLSGDPHNARGSTPGLGIVQVAERGRSGRLAGIVRLSNVGADGVERADPHGLRVRRMD